MKQVAMIPFLIFLFAVGTSFCVEAQNVNGSQINKAISQFDYDTAISLIDVELADTLTDKSRSRELCLLKARCQKKLYRFGAAVQTLSYWNEVYQEVDMEVMAELAECHIQNGDYEKAFSCYYFLTTVNPANVYFAMQLASLLYRSENYAASAKAGKSALVRDTTSIPMLSLVGNSYNMMDLKDSALVYYDRILAINPMDVKTISKKSKILLDQAKYSEAAVLAEQYLKSDSTNLLVNSIYGLALHLDKKYEHSQEVFHRQLNMGDSTYSTYYYLGLNDYLLNIKNKAEDYFSICYAKDSSDVNLIYYYAASKLWHPRKNGESRRLLDKAVKMLQPDSTIMCKIYAAYGQGYYNDKNYKKTIDSYLQSMKYAPSFTSPLYTIGYCYEMMDDFHKALEYYERSLKYLKKESDLYYSIENRIDDVKKEIFFREH